MFTAMAVFAVVLLAVVTVAAWRVKKPVVIKWIKVK
jgi:hypothetical protein